jgi:hypothetical protein
MGREIVGMQKIRMLQVTNRRIDIQYDSFYQSPWPAIYAKMFSLITTPMLLVWAAGRHFFGGVALAFCAWRNENNNLR